MVNDFSLTLNAQRKRDMSTVLNFFLWLIRRSDINLSEYEPSLKNLVELLDRVKYTGTGKKIWINLDEFLLLYTCSQYTLKAMNGKAGPEYIADTLGNQHNYDWFEKQRTYFISISMHLIKECKDRLTDLPDFAKERMHMEEQIKPF